MLSIFSNFPSLQFFCIFELFFSILICHFCCSSCFLANIFLKIVRGLLIYEQFCVCVCIYVYIYIYINKMTSSHTLAATSHLLKVISTYTLRRHRILLIGYQSYGNMIKWMGFLPSCNYVHTTVCMHHSDINKIHREKNRLELHKNAILNRSGKQYTTNQQVYSH